MNATIGQHPAGKRLRAKPRKTIDHWLRWVLCAFALTCALLLGLVLTLLIHEAWPLLSNTGISAFLNGHGWYPLEGKFGVLPMLYSSLALATGALAVAAPLGLGCAIFAVFYAPPRLSAYFRGILNLLAGIPSVVFGLWGLTALVPIISQWQPPGTSLLAGSCVLALMVLPTIALTSAAALESVPRSLLAGAAALGFRRQTTILSVAIPTARDSIISGCLLATARALGETMVVLMVAGNVVQNPHGPFEPVRAVTANIALEMAYAMGDHRASLFAAGLLLTLLIWGLALLATRISGKELKMDTHG
jgi:phosphate transport system permease protein